MRNATMHRKTGPIIKVLNNGELNFISFFSAVEMPVTRHPLHSPGRVVASPHFH